LISTLIKLVHEVCFFEVQSWHFKGWYTTGSFRIASLYLIAKRIGGALFVLPGFQRANPARHGQAKEASYLPLLFFISRTLQIRYRINFWQLCRGHWGRRDQPGLWQPPL